MKITQYGLQIVFLVWAIVTILIEHLMNKKNHGGKRKGAGRKPKEPTVVKRIPISKLESVQNLLDSKLVITHPERKKK